MNKRTGKALLGVGVAFILMGGSLSGSTITFGTQIGGGWTDGIGTPVQTGVVPAVYVTPDSPYQWISDGPNFVGASAVTMPNGYVDNFFYSFVLPADSVIVSATEKVCADDTAGVWSNGIFLGRVIGFSDECHTVDIASTLHAGVNNLRYEVRQEHLQQYALYVDAKIVTAPKAPEPGTWLMLLAGMGVIAGSAMARRLSRAEVTPLSE